MLAHHAACFYLNIIQNNNKLNIKESLHNVITKAGDKICSDSHNSMLESINLQESVKKLAGNTNRITVKIAKIINSANKKEAESTKLFQQESLLISKGNMKHIESYALDAVVKAVYNDGDIA
jgi:hypothetical protein